MIADFDVLPLDLRTSIEEGVKSLSKFQLYLLTRKEIPAKFGLHHFYCLSYYFEIYCAKQQWKLRKKDFHLIQQKRIINSFIIAFACFFICAFGFYSQVNYVFKIFFFLIGFLGMGFIFYFVDLVEDKDLK